MIKDELELKRQFKDKIILITGGTGSIGHGIIKQLINFKPKQIGNLVLYRFFLHLNQKCR